MAETLKVIPRHVAVIMDGNGRWAKARGLARIAGHRAGMQSVREIIRASADFGVPVLTLYAFSSENWKRPQDEVSALLGLLNFFIEREFKSLAREGVQIRTIGHIEDLPPSTVERIERARAATKTNTKLILNIALNYGARREIVDAASSWARDLLSHEDPMSKTASLTEEAFSKYLSMADLPDPDLLIRTSGEMRVSNFLLWQISYAELYVTRKFWPDFKRADYLKALRAFGRRTRRFGDISATASRRGGVS